MIRAERFDLVVDSYAEGLLSLDDAVALLAPLSVSVLAGPALGRQTNPDGQTPNAGDPGSWDGPAALKRRLNDANGPGAPGRPGRSADRTSTKAG